MGEAGGSGARRTRVLVARDPTADGAAIAEAAGLLRAGELVAFPTETVYGLGADATNPDAVEAIFAAKGRPHSDPVIVHLAGADWLERAARDVPEVARALARRFWPGPLTLVLPRAPGIPALVAAGGETVGVRVPAHPIAQALIRATGLPVAAPSANRFMHTSPTTAEHVLADLDGRIACVLDGGPTLVGVESTVVDLTVAPARLLRPGGVAVEALRALLPDLRVAAGDGERAAGQVAEAEAASGPAHAPGQMERHYAPATPLIVYDGEGPAAADAVLAEARAARARGERVAALVPDEEAGPLLAAGAQVVALGPASDLAAIARALYGALRTADTLSADRLLAHTFGAAGLGLALRDRLRRAAGGTLRPLP